MFLSQVQHIEYTTGILLSEANEMIEEICSENISLEMNMHIKMIYFRMV